MSNIDSDDQQHLLNFWSRRSPEELRQEIANLRSQGNDRIAEQLELLHNQLSERRAANRKVNTSKQKLQAVPSPLNVKTSTQRRFIGPNVVEDIIVVESAYLTNEAKPLPDNVDERVIDTKIETIMFPTAAVKEDSVGPYSRQINDSSDSGDFIAEQTSSHKHDPNFENFDQQPQELDEVDRADDESIQPSILKSGIIDNNQLMRSSELAKEKSNNDNRATQTFSISSRESLSPRDLELTEETDSLKTIFSSESQKSSPESSSRNTALSDDMSTSIPIEVFSNVRKEPITFPKVDTNSNSLSPSLNRPSSMPSSPQGDEIKANKIVRKVTTTREIYRILKPLQIIATLSEDLNFDDVTQKKRSVATQAFAEKSEDETPSRPFVEKDQNFYELVRFWIKRPKLLLADEINVLEENRNSEAAARLREVNEYIQHPPPDLQEKLDRLPPLSNRYAVYKSSSPRLVPSSPSLESLSDSESLQIVPSEPSTPSLEDLDDESIIEPSSPSLTPLEEETIPEPSTPSVTGTSLSLLPNSGDSVEPSMGTDEIRDSSPETITKHINSTFSAKAVPKYKVQLIEKITVEKVQETITKVREKVSDIDMNREKGPVGQQRRSKKNDIISKESSTVSISALTDDSHSPVVESLDKPSNNYRVIGGPVFH